MQSNQLSTAELSDLFFEEDLPSSSPQPRQLKESSLMIGPWKTGADPQKKTGQEPVFRRQTGTTVIEESRTLRPACSNQQVSQWPQDPIIAIDLTSKTNIVKKVQSERQPKVVIRSSRPIQIGRNNPAKLQSRLFSSNSPTAPIIISLASTESRGRPYLHESQSPSKPPSGSQRRAPLSPISKDKDSLGKSHKEQPREAIRISPEDKPQRSTAKKMLFAITNQLSSSTGAAQDKEMRRVFIGLNESESKQISSFGDYSLETSPNSTHARTFALKHQPKRELFRAAFRKKQTATHRECPVQVGKLSKPLVAEVIGPTMHSLVKPSSEALMAGVQSASKSHTHQARDSKSQKTSLSPQQALHLRKKVYHDLIKHTSQLHMKKNNTLNIFQYL